MVGQLTSVFEETEREGKGKSNNQYSYKANKDMRIQEIDDYSDESEESTDKKKSSLSFHFLNANSRGRRNSKFS